MDSPDLHMIDGRPWFPAFARFVDGGQVTVVEDYDGANADLYDQLRADPAEELAYYRAHLAERGPRVLELGCGTGTLTLPLAAAGADVTGVDASRAMVARLTARVPDARVVVADMVDYVRHAAADSFDLVLIPYNALVHVTQAAQRQILVAESARILRSGGLMIIDSWLPRRRGRRLRSAWQTVPGPGGGWMLYSQQTFPERDCRVANLLTIPVAGGRPFATSITEHVFTRAELRALVRGAGLRCRVLDRDHPLVDGAAERCVIEGTKP